MGEYAFCRCAELERVYMEPGLTRIPDYAFSGCAKMKEIRMADTVNSIGFSAFLGCGGLRELSIPGGVTRIKSAAFKGCSMLSNIQGGEGVESMGKYAFKNCPASLSPALSRAYAVQAASGGRREGHFADNGRFPVEFVGWGGEGLQTGPAFRINEKCFPACNAGFLYVDDGITFPDEYGDWVAELTGSICSLSSGISKAAVVNAKMADGTTRLGIRFQMDRRAIKKTILLNYEQCETAAAGEYILTVPRGGEFECMLYPLSSDGVAGPPLLRDGFCIK